MSDVQTAKRSLGCELRALDGFVGVGIGEDGIWVYAIAETAPVVRVLNDRWGYTYEGVHVSAVLSDGFKSQSLNA